MSPFAERPNGARFPAGRICLVHIWWLSSQINRIPRTLALLVDVFIVTSAIILPVILIIILIIFILIIIL